MKRFSAAAKTALLVATKHNERQSKTSTTLRCNWIDARTFSPIDQTKSDRFARPEQDSVVESRAFITVANIV